MKVGHGAQQSIRADAWISRLQVKKETKTKTVTAAFLKEVQPLQCLLLNLGFHLSLDVY